ncbi:stage VI sporulation protein F [Terribacillus saccharophilus]|uniref:stage VI sporulation protein F n=1 Tax=Terribacillus saccharophilus TaxID=361277 RepID=UPI003982A4EC
MNVADFQKNLIDQIQKKSNVKAEDIYKVANSVKSANLQDEATVRGLVKQLAAMAGKPLTAEKEDKIVKAIIGNNMPTDMSTLSKLFKN